MEKIQDNINRFLPYGSALLQVISHKTISKADIRNFLRNKGIFVANDGDEYTFPLSASMLPSPNEFEYVVEKLRTKEDRPKIITRTLEWKSEENLINAIPNDFSIPEIIKTTYPRYTVVGSPNFRPVDNNPNEIEINIKCEVQDYSRAWYRSSNEFTSQITLKKVATADNKVELQIVHTSPETLEISDKVARKLEHVFKQHNHMDSKQAIKHILYRDFDNVSRIKFFLSLTAGNSMFTFEKASFIEFGPDPTFELPNNINWMEAKVKDLKVSGENLHEILFIRDSSLHQYLEFASFIITYKFAYHAASGRCKLKAGFAYYPNRNAGAEFTLNIDSITLDDDYAHLNQQEVRKFLLKQFESFKNEKYNSVITVLSAA